MTEDRGVLEQVRDLLNAGLSSRAVIDRGYRPGSVYHAQRQIWRRWRHAGASSGVPHASGSHPDHAAQVNATLQAENATLSAELGRLRNDAENARNEVTVLRQQWETALGARDEAQQALAEAEQEASRQSQKRQRLEEALSSERSQRQQLAAENARLKPLAVWSDHPCAACSRPMRGIIERKEAAQRLRDCAHPACIANRSAFDIATGLMTNSYSLTPME